MTEGVTVQNPFPGLRPFEADESTLFFGRDEQIGAALDRLLRQKMLAVVGVSGCGKSSLVGAGMVPALEMGLGGDPEQRWRVATMRPGDGPLRELARCLGFYGRALAERTYGLLEAVETHLPVGENLLVVVDQFEEIFPFRDRKLREGAGSEADLFLSYLIRASQDPAGRVYVVLTMRSDYLGECAKFHGLPEAFNDGQYLVPRMTRQQLQEAIEGPLQAAAVGIHPVVVQDLLNQCGEEPDNLPLLQHLLRRMFEQWELEGGQGLITAAIAESVGGLAAALDRDAETVYGGLSSEETRVAEVLFRRITESRRQADREEDDRPVRRPQTVADLANLARVSEAVLRRTVRRFEERGLLVVRQTDRGDKVDLPHECPCWKWRRLESWIRSETEDAKKLRFLSDAVGRGHLTGLALSEALEWQRDGRLDSEWCLRYLSAEQAAGVAAWVKESQRIVEEAAEVERRRKEEERRDAKERSRRPIGSIESSIGSMADLGPSYLPNVLQVIRELGSVEFVSLRLGPIPWWNTRLHLVAALASDFTDVRQFVILDAGGRFLTMSAPAEIRRALAKAFPKLEMAYLQAWEQVRGWPGDEANLIISCYPSALRVTYGGQEESDLKEEVTPESLAELRIKQQGEVVEQFGAELSALLNSKVPRREAPPYVVLFRDGNLEAIIDRMDLALQIATAAL